MGIQKAQNANELITKSLEEIDNLVGLFKANSPTNVLAKGGDKNLNPGDVSDDAPAPDQDTDTDTGNNDSDMDTDTDTDSDNDTDTDTDGESEEDTNADDNTNKSITETITGGDTVKKALEVSDFLRDLVQGISSVIEAQSTEFSKSITASTATQDLLAKSFQGIVTVQRAVLETQAEILKSNGSLQGSFETMQKSLNRANNRLKALEDQPLVRKSVSSANAKVIEKSFGGAGSTNTLSKSQASDKLLQAFQGGNSEVRNDLLAFDSTGDFNVLSPEGKRVLGITQ